MIISDLHGGDVVTLLDTDQAAGYDVGLNHGRQRVFGRLSDRDPPEHFDWRRRGQWRVGYEAGLRERARRSTIFTWTDPLTGAAVSKTYKGHVGRSRVVNRLAVCGVSGYVMVAYFAGPKMLGEHRCGI